MIYDFCIVGGGIVGLSAAMEIKRQYSSASILILEKEASLASHQTSHNSGVIHAGIYYMPGSLKAQLCREGNRATKEFCEENSIKYENCGKLVVATNYDEEKRIDNLYNRAFSNGLTLRKVSKEELVELEPNIVGTKALLCEETGIVSYSEIAQKMANLLMSSGCEIVDNSEVTRIIEKSDAVELGVLDTTYYAKKIVVCGGLQADRLARLAGLAIDFSIIPFRGEYFELPKSKNGLVRHLIYPAPDPSLPFLGVHLTKMIDGSITVGPNAVLGFSREGYQKFSFKLDDFLSTVGFSGFWKLLWNNRRHALHEIKGSIFKEIYLRDCRKYCPSLEKSDLLPFRAGIRAQLVTKEGVPFHDFMFAQTNRMLHVFNAPSPAATSAIPIGKMIAGKLLNISS